MSGPISKDDGARLMLLAMERLRDCGEYDNLASQAIVDVVGRMLVPLDLLEAVNEYIAAQTKTLEARTRLAERLHATLLQEPAGKKALERTMGR